jgi:ribosomal protein L40E
MLREPTEVERRLRRDVCDRCGARPGYPCRSRSGKSRSDSHAPRYLAALVRGDVPLPDGAGE